MKRDWIRFFSLQDQADCTDTGFKTLENNKKPLFVKELRKVWDEDANHGLPQRHRGRFSPSNTLLIDDSPYKALLNPVSNSYLNSLIHSPLHLFGSKRVKLRGCHSGCDDGTILL